MRAVRARRRSCRAAPGSSAGTRRRLRSRASGSASRCSITVSTSAPGMMRSATCAHRVLDAVQLLPTPRVGLVEVELDAVEVARIQRVALATDRVVLATRAARTPRPGSGRATRTRRWPASPAPRAASRNAWSTEPAASYSSTSVRKNGRVAGSWPPQVSACCVHATACRRAATTPWAAPSASAASMLDESLGHQRDALGDHLPVVGGVAGHQVERHAHGLHRAAEHAQVAQSLAGLVLGERAARAVRASPRRRCDRGRHSRASTASSARSVARSSSARSAAPSGE